jgi:hypothetical protein
MMWRVAMWRVVELVSEENYFDKGNQEGIWEKGWCALRIGECHPLTLETSSYDSYWENNRLICCYAIRPFKTCAGASELGLVLGIRYRHRNSWSRSGVVLHDASSSATQFTPGDTLQICTGYLSIKTAPKHIHNLNTVQCT